jgi:PLP dependent protein
MDQLADRWKNVQQKIEQACYRVGRTPTEVHVVAVTKYIDIEETKQVLTFGLNHIGESRVQAATLKWKALGNRAIWHFIGHLQRNKVKEVVGRFSYLHSLDRFSLVEELARCLRQKNVTIQCFIQVNLSGEETKFGVSAHQLEEFAREVANFSLIEVVGLMTMAPIVAKKEEVRPIFRELKRLQARIRRFDHARLRVPHLSMGMSQDYEIAIEEGATWIRLGSALVGGNR